jgi:hypothetical protein
MYVPPFFSVENRDSRLNPRDRVVFIEHGEQAAAIPFAVLELEKRITFDVGGRSFDVIRQPDVTSTLDDTEVFSPFAPAVARDEAKVTGSADVVDSATGERAAFDTPFWFAVAAFRPDVTLVQSR